jgi:O-antigen/teichoic acid export membrane protein
MKKVANRIIKNPLISGSSFIFSGTLLANVFNFIFSIYMLAHLSSADNGTLIALISFTTLPMLAANSIAPAIIRFAGPYFVHNDTAKLHGLYIKVGRVYFGVAVSMFVLFLIFVPQISSFFKIDNYLLLVLANIIIFIGYFNVLNISFLQAKLAFKYYSMLTILSTLLKLIFGIALVMAGYAVNGAFTAILISVLIPFLLSFIPLKFLFNKVHEKVAVNSKEIFAYGLPSSFVVLGQTVFITGDILLVKHFFQPDEAGFYAGISLIGRVIFYFSAPIGTVMYPLIIQKMSKNEPYKNTFLLSLLLVLIPSLGITTFYFLFPEFVMHFFRIKQTSLYQPYLLGLFGAFISIYSVVTLLIHLYLSIKKTIIAIPVFLSALLQMVLIWFFHSSFIAVVLDSLFATFLLLIVLLLYYPYATKGKQP